MCKLWRNLLMTIKQLIDKLRENFHIKAICLVIAIFIYIFHQVSIVESKTLVIPLTVVENGAVMNVGEIPSAITVKVRTGANNISHILNSDIKAIVNLDNIEFPGNYDIPVSINISNKLKEMDPLEISIKPEVVNVTVDRKAVKYVSVQPTIVGEVARGYEISKIEVEPAFVQVRGPESVLKYVDTITTTSVNVSNAKTNFSTSAENLQLNQKYSIMFKGEYKVTISIAPLPFEKEYENVPIDVVNLNSNLKVSNKIGSANFVLMGDMPKLESYIPDKNFVYVDLSKIHEPGEYETPVLIKNNTKFEIKNLSVSNVKINVIKNDNQEITSE